MAFRLLKSNPVLFKQVRSISTSKPQLFSDKISQAGKLISENINKASKTVSENVDTLVSKAGSTATGSSKTLLVLKDKVIYGSKVGAELAKEVYKREAMAPPSVEQIHQARSELANLFNAKFIKSLNKEHLYKGLYYGTQIYGFFLVGEMIGRFNVIGYAI